MATIIHKMKKGRPYYYAVASGRVNGKPRIVWQKYLGTVDAIVARAQGSKPPKPKEAVLFEAGGVAGLLRIAQRLKLMDVIDTAVPKRDQGPSVAHYMILAALNRALSPCSKLAIGDWYEQTVLRRLWRFEKTAFSSQRFWDHMSMVSPAAIEAIQTALVPGIRGEFGVDAEVLLYDTTNFFTFLSTVNERCPIAQRGHRKAKRNDLRQVGLALLVTRDFQVPLFHRVYEGNVPDVSLFPALAHELIARHRQMDAQGRATLVFDKGNVSEDAMEQLVVARQPFIAAVPLSRLPKLAATPLDQFFGSRRVAGNQGVGRARRSPGRLLPCRPCLHRELLHPAIGRRHPKPRQVPEKSPGPREKAQQIIATYRSLTQIEEVFKNMKNADFLRWQPAYHWTEQKLKVHGLYCVLALLLATLARKIATQAGIDLTLPAMRDELNAIREVAVIYPQGTLAHPKDHITLSRMSPTQRKLADALQVAKVLQG